MLGKLKMLQQELLEKNNTIKQLEEVIDYKNKEIEELRYNLTVAEKNITAINAIIDSLLKCREPRLRQARAVEVEQKNRSVKPRKQNTSK